MAFFDLPLAWLMKTSRVDVMCHSRNIVSRYAVGKQTAFAPLAVHVYETALGGVAHYFGVVQIFGTQAKIGDRKGERWQGDVGF